MQPVTILVLSAGVPAATVAALAERFDVLGPGSPDEIEALVSAHGARIRGIATTGKARLDRALLARLPALDLVACYSAGLDKIDTDALAERGIPLTNSSAALADEVADLAIALMIMARRRLVAAEAHVRSGAWAEAAFPLGRSLTGLRIGLLGLGHIGSAIAHRAKAMGMQPRHCTRRPVAGCAYPHHADARALAADSDVFVIACPGGPANRGLVDRNVIAALGSDATLVNIARGEVVDEPALIDALASGRLGSAGLDVFADEPNVPLALRQLDNVVLAPHLGSATIETRHAMGESVVRSLERLLKPG
ncbi:2-ketogluconate reductase [Bosea sp. 62]|uniref:2-hydroxyacid dehydrogenase n=1 Tax=unclassified Bosea (in: a-proteobacteria) TaxID=2653178 RepID=UPI00125457A4|nr:MULTISPECIES: 2-hydroxyacid dehydrogenase [unclassified Bosea (in: a-proteobacteria)]CAD5255012.1 2-ketogluconate reductase [Bosea sp. 21B]CAD5285315.1 2-ketogluconate reductase [Bosea sp. 7B]CAD5301550.1 2-ketogluconate reductase [Bosea sp. 46]VVT57665.1 2-ketogluconate reductase [Bosea sp. EC-HK365B]VXB29170.1 2-ketogluconate reductase [Bosea sp. 29B]